MSYDVSLNVNTGHRMASVGDRHLNYTYNVAPMFRIAFDHERGLRCLDGKSGADAAKLLHKATARFHAQIERMRELNPANGWGDADSALEFLQEVREECREHPLAIVRVT